MTYDLVAAYAAFATRLEAWLNSDECTAGWVGVCVLRVVHRQIHEAARRFAQMELELQQDAGEELHSGEGGVDCTNT